MINYYNTGEVDIEKVIGELVVHSVEEVERLERILRKIDGGFIRVRASDGERYYLTKDYEKKIAVGSENK